MGDENFDPCECVWGHEFSMRRLLNMLRQSQSLCTDTECFNDGTQPPANTPSPDYYIVMSIMLGIYFFMHMWLWNNNRNRMDEPSKPSINGNGTPPTPPPTSS